MTLPLWLAACAPPSAALDQARVALDVLPQRTLSLAEAKSELWRTELRPAWRSPTAAEAEAVATLIPELLTAAASGTVDPGAQSLAASVAMRIERWDVAGAQHLVLSEQPDQRRGAGAYVFSSTSPASSDPWLLWQAPHAYYDRNTGAIAAALYFQPPPGPAPSAFFTNTLHRYTQADGKRSKQATSPADACHSKSHLFDVATQAAARARPGATVLQLHGFVNDAEADDEGGDGLPDDGIAVLSAGDPAAPTALSTLAATRLQGLLGAGVYLFPTQAKALGATTNVQGQGLRDVPTARFLHVETSDSLRDLLVQDPSRRAAFGAALFTLGTTR